MGRHPEALPYEQLWAQCKDMAADLPGLQIQTVRHYYDDHGERQRWFGVNIVWRATPEITQLLGTAVAHEITASPTFHYDEDLEPLDANGTFGLERRFIRAMGQPNSKDGRFVEKTVDLAPEQADPGETQRLTRLAMSQCGALKYTKTLPPEQPVDVTGQQTPPATPNSISLTVYENSQGFESATPEVAVLNRVLSLIVRRDIVLHAENWRLARLPIDRRFPPNDLYMGPAIERHLKPRQPLYEVPGILAIE